MTRAVISRGLDFGAIALGTAQFAFKDVSDVASIATVDAALDAGVRLIDTALAYNRPGHVSYVERLLSRVLVRRGREAFTIATKGGHWRDRDDFPIDGSPAALRSHCEISLRALGVEQIDLYQLHHIDPKVPLGESILALVGMQREGKIREIGLSNASIAQLEEAMLIAPIASVQNRLSFDLDDDKATADYCAAHGLAYLAYMPFGGAAGSLRGPGDVREAIAARLGVSWQQVTLAWMMTLSDTIVPIVGASRPASITDSLASVALKLTNDDRSALSRGSIR